jgi:hypothetical protein
MPYLYVAINSSMPGLVKIGKTTRDSRERLRELSAATGVPVAFELAFETFSEDVDKLETAIHRELDAHRTNDRREFFRFPLNEVIQLILKHQAKPVEANSIWSAEEILPALKDRFGSRLKPTLTSVRIVQPQDRVWLEMTEVFINGARRDETITRTDLDFIGDDDGPMFDPHSSITANVSRFLKLDGYDLIMCLDLMSDAGAKQIEKEWQAKTGWERLMER